MCADAVRQLGISRSVGQVFGVVYCSPQPLSFVDVVKLLDLSKGSVSQGLRFLRKIGAIRIVEMPSDRREYFTPETELRRLLTGVLHTRIRDPLRAGCGRIKVLRRKLATSEEFNRDFLEQRLCGLESWHRKALFAIPLIQKVLGPRVS
jgi:DNA-binding transcriptional regulator GbsR (MarR family)